MAGHSTVLAFLFSLVSIHQSHNTPEAFSYLTNLLSYSTFLLLCKSIPDKEIDL